MTLCLSSAVTPVLSVSTCERGLWGQVSHLYNGRLRLNEVWIYSLEYRCWVCMWSTNRQPSSISGFKMKQKNEENKWNKRISGYRNKTLPVNLIKTKWKDMVWCEMWESFGVIMIYPSSHRPCWIRASSLFLWRGAGNKCRLTAFWPKRGEQKYMWVSQKLFMTQRNTPSSLPASALLEWANDVQGFWR